ncbi:helix-turn-helix domain-containing protein [Mesorhizobium sp. ES1-4]|uniref:helix-turn-helix domain-containing protein n=1 Tax=Mesorhizobium sp. ES1-4 TaxID=2876627 RepID=UPI001CCDB480|nr:response regulator transcription factor [Mesorhizobium sp. ES1-4]MBZ9795356.1 response regulator transcription factor [Mesorhizobium sp. ES1-4]
MRSTVGGGAGESWARRILLTVFPADGFPECLVYAIEREFPSVVVEQTTSLETACTVFDHPVCLILVDAGLLDKIGAYGAGLMQNHPVAPIVLAQNGSRIPASIQDILDLKIVRSVLPMDLKLDVWLSVIGLMLRGGEYFPPTMFQSYAGSLRQEVADYSASIGQPMAERSDFEEIGALTDRELQVLEMVARGSQNKIIAATLRLSEHTVKIHLHNIITKLGAHNRTEAAAVFHAHTGSFFGSLGRSKAGLDQSSP